MTHVEAPDPTRLTKLARNRAALQDVARAVLDRLEITDLVYHELSFAEPLVLDLLQQALARTPAGSRILLTFGHRYLAEVLLDLGYVVDVWEPVGAPLGEELQPHVVATVDFDADSLAPGKGGPYAAILAPLLLDHTRAHPSAVLRGLSALLEPGAPLILAATNLGRLGIRLRALRGQGFLPDPRHLPPTAHGAWPQLPQHRFSQPAETAAWAQEAGLAVSASAYSLGQAPFYRAIPLSIPNYLSLQGKHLLKRAMAPLREYFVMTLEATPPSAPVQLLPELAPPEAWLPESSAKLPFVSVVLPSRDRAPLLRKALPPLFTQTYPADRYEIVLVDDGSVDDTPDVIAELAPRAPCMVQTTRSSGIGAAAARNLGVEMARGEIVAHVDDDCEVSPGWIEAGVLGFERNVALVGGPIVLRPGTPLGFFDWYMIYPEDNGTYPTSNVFYRREVARAAGGFDESFGRNLLGRPVWGWDCDLAWRLLRQGYEGRFRDAVAYAHIFRLTPKRWLLEGWRAGSMMPSVIRAVPELRSRVLIGGIFYTSYGLAFKLGLVGTALAVVAKRPAWLALWLPWLRWATSMAAHDRWPPTRWPQLGTKLLLLFGLHALTAAGLAYGSYRARRLLL